MEERREDVAMMQEMTEMDGEDDPGAAQLLLAVAQMKRLSSELLRN